MNHVETLILSCLQNLCVFSFNFAWGGGLPGCVPPPPLGCANEGHIPLHIVFQLSKQPLKSFCGSPQSNSASHLLHTPHAHKVHVAVTLRLGFTRNFTVSHWQFRLIKHNRDKLKNGYKNQSITRHYRNLTERGLAHDWGGRFGYKQSVLTFVSDQCSEPTRAVAI